VFLVIFSAILSKIEKNFSKNRPLATEPSLYLFILRDVDLFSPAEGLKQLKIA
jgi:hypothetical protein